MPHIVIEHSQSLEKETDIQDLMKECVSILNEANEFSPPAIKARAQAFTNVVLHDNYTDFIHVTISILEGRPIELQKSITQSVFNAIKAKITNSSVSISVDLNELQKETYCK